MSIFFVYIIICLPIYLSGHLSIYLTACFSYSYFCFFITIHPRLFLVYTFQLFIFLLLRVDLCLAVSWCSLLCLPVLCCASLYDHLPFTGLCILLCLALPPSTSCVYLCLSVFFVWLLFYAVIVLLDQEIVFH